jgi:hypothetical protein
MILKPQLIVYLRRSDLFIAGNHLPTIKLTFPGSVVHNLTLQDKNKFVHDTEEVFVSKNVSGKRVLIVLDDSMVFAKSVNLEETDKNTLNKIVADYVDCMPFEPGQRACLTLQNDKILDLYATNSDIYLALEEAMRRSKVRKIIATVPAAAYKFKKMHTNAEIINSYINDKEIYRIADFNSVSPA